MAAFLLQLDQKKRTFSHMKNTHNSLYGLNRKLALFYFILFVVKT